MKAMSERVAPHWGQSMGVRIEVESRACFMQEGDGPRHHDREALGPGLPPLQHEDAAHHGVDDLATQVSVASQGETKRPGHGHHPLAQRHRGDDLLVKV